MLKGVVGAPMSEFSCITLTDWEGNSVCVPIASSLTVIFSTLSILKASEMNRRGLHCSGSVIFWIPVVLWDPE